MLLTFKLKWMLWFTRLQFVRCSHLNGTCHNWIWPILPKKIFYFILNSNLFSSTNWQLYYLKKLFFFKHFPCLKTHNVKVAWSLTPSTIIKFFFGSWSFFILNAPQTVIELDMGLPIRTRPAHRMRHRHTWVLKFWFCCRVFLFR